MIIWLFTTSQTLLLLYLTYSQYSFISPRMASVSLISLDPVVLEQINLLAELKADDHSSMLSWAIDILEGSDVTSSVVKLTEKLGLSSPSKLVKICTALATLIWECSKVVAKNTASLPGLLVQAGVSEPVIAPFCQIFTSSKNRINALKGSLGLDMPSYKDLAWRLDIELGKRSLLSTVEPNFQLRLDLTNNTILTNRQEHQVYHIQSDYANMKFLQQELQRAVDEYAGVHSQRISRYIS